jgi:hypothetical protein
VLTLVGSTVVDPFSGGTVVQAPHQPVLEPATLLLRLGSFVAGAQALEDYAEIVEDAAPEEAEAARRQARLGRARLN